MFAVSRAPFVLSPVLGFYERKLETVLRIRTISDEKALSVGSLGGRVQLAPGPGFIF